MPTINELLDIERTGDVAGNTGAIFDEFQQLRQALGLPRPEKTEVAKQIQTNLTQPEKSPGFQLAQNLLTERQAVKKRNLNTILQKSGLAGFASGPGVQRLISGERETDIELGNLALGTQEKARGEALDLTRISETVFGNERRQARSGTESELNRRAAQKRVETAADAGFFSSLAGFGAKAIPGLLDVLFKDGGIFDGLFGEEEEEEEGGIGGKIGTAVSTGAAATKTGIGLLTGGGVDLAALDATLLSNLGITETDIATTFLNPPGGFDAAIAAAFPDLATGLVGPGAIAGIPGVFPGTVGGVAGAGGPFGSGLAGSASGFAAAQSAIAAAEAAGGITAGVTPGPGLAAAAAAIASFTGFSVSQVASLLNPAAFILGPASVFATIALLTQDKPNRSTQFQISAAESLQPNFDPIFGGGEGSQVSSNNQSFPSEAGRTQGETTSGGIPLTDPAFQAFRPLEALAKAAGATFTGLPAGQGEADRFARIIIGNLFDRGATPEQAAALFRSLGLSENQIAGPIAEFKRLKAAAGPITIPNVKGFNPISGTRGVTIPKDVTPKDFFTGAQEANFSQINAVLGQSGIDEFFENPIAFRASLDPRLAASIFDDEIDDVGESSFGDE